MLREAVLREIAERDIVSSVGWCYVDDVSEVWMIGTRYIGVHDGRYRPSLCSVKPGRLELMLLTIPSLAGHSTHIPLCPPNTSPTYSIPSSIRL